jgi:hypothetical protein
VVRAVRQFVLDRVGQPGTGSDAAKSFAHYGRRVSGRNTA